MLFFNKIHHLISDEIQLFKAQRAITQCIACTCHISNPVPYIASYSASGDVVRVSLTHNPREANTYIHRKQNHIKKQYFVMSEIITLD